MRIPIVASALVLAAVGVMIALGIWQLQRADWKTGLIASYELAAVTTDTVSYPVDPAAREAVLYRRSSVHCSRVSGVTAIAGRNARNEQGWAHTVRCATATGEVEVALGWSRNPDPSKWNGGAVTGWIAPAGKGVRLVANPPLGGLEQLIRPDPRDMPNNHISYAFQWFFFALTALVIYVLALRKRMRGD